MTTSNDADIGTEWNDDDTAPATTTEAQPAPEPEAAPDPDPASAAQDHDDRPKNDWVQKRIDELTKKRREAETQLETERQQRADLERRLQALQAPQDGQPNPSERVYTQAELQAEARRLAQEEAKQFQAQQQAQAFAGKCNEVYSHGVEKYGKPFETAVANLNLSGVVSETDMTFLELVVETENPAAVLKYYGENPTAAMALVAQNPVKAALEMDRLSRKLSEAPAAAPISKAPPPITPITGERSRADVDLYNDDVSDAEWFAERKRQRAARGG